MLHDLAQRHGMHQLKERGSLANLSLKITGINGYSIGKWPTATISWPMIKSLKF